MADKKITELTALTTLSNDDLLVVVDDPSGTPVTKKITASNLKAGLAPTASPTFTGTVTLPSDTSIGNVSHDEISYLDGVTSAIQTQLNGKVAATVVDAKGDLLVGSADNTVARLQVGTNAYVLTANSGATYGVEWAAVPASAPDSENAIVAAAVFI